MMPKPIPIPAAHPADLLAEVFALRPEVERILRGDSRHPDTVSVDDKVQIVLLNVTRHLSDYQPHADGMRPWVSRIAQNVQRDSARSVRRQRRALGNFVLVGLPVRGEDVVKNRVDSA
jgi:DNA-directed RNA polymerase specialized sigma24 family protein